MDSDRRVIVLPGRAFGPFAPQLFFPMFAAMRRGADPSTVEWDEASYFESQSGEPIDWVTRHVEPVLREARPSASLVVGKSLGTYAAGLVAEMALPAIWLTPLLSSPVIQTELGRASAPFLLIGGSADPSWSMETAQDLTPHVLEIAGADHGLFVSGPLSRSADNMARIAEASERFLDAHVWPSPVSSEG